MTVQTNVHMHLSDDPQSSAHVLWDGINTPDACVTIDVEVEGHKLVLFFHELAPLRAFLTATAEAYGALGRAILAANAHELATTEAAQL